MTTACAGALALREPGGGGTKAAGRGATSRVPNTAGIETVTNGF